ncbi:NAD(P)-binding protein [Lentithecium fluviatile CBS 122367]|uniref:NAD(P)-binding protein n=1 Tax=Lentithecium fluviatile CBS 122367 TaxID=1168545 RepID=A0A6G1IDV8_9PLEO|nr:NAD(P)-binding protein [Lentithecium fluviatile CBS 122367]
MSPVIAVAGGSHGLGRAIVDGLKADGRYEVVILGRKANPELEKETGARVLAADYTNTDALVKLLEENKIDTVITTLNAGMDITPETNLVHAAARSSVTRRYIPNVWSALVYKPEHAASFPFAGLRFQIMDELRKTNLEWTAIYNGIFMEYYVSGLPTHLEKYAIAVDVEAGIAGIPASGNVPIAFTYSRDIGRFVAALQSVEKWEQDYRIVGDTKTWNEVVAIAEKAKGVKFDVAHDSVEKLQKGQITELPLHKKAYALLGGAEVAKPMVQGMYAQYGLWMEQGLFVYKDNATVLNDVFPEIKPLGLAEAWEKAGGKA